MDEQDGAIMGQPDAETARTGPYGVEEDAGSRDPQEGGYRASEGDDSPTAGTVLPGDEDNVRQIALESTGAENEHETVSADNTLDLGLGQAGADLVSGDAESTDLGNQSDDARELSQAEGA